LIQIYLHQGIVHSRVCERRAKKIKIDLSITLHPGWYMTLVHVHNCRGHALITKGIGNHAKVLHCLDENPKKK
jgi:hypothetical protein